jgi:peroxiredoxin
MSNFKLIPGTVFPLMTVPLVGGGETTLVASNGQPKLIIVYRGHFCPFCRGKL